MCSSCQEDVDCIEKILCGLLQCISIAKLITQNDEGYIQSPKKSCSVVDENGSYSQLLDMIVIRVAVNC